jgi:hypothetical protein
MGHLLLLSAVTNRERNGATAFVFDCINMLAGWVDDVHMYSNMMTTITFTMKEDRLGEFVDALAGAGISVELAKDDGLAAMRPVERSCSLQISFIHNEPDLTREVPAIPGY